MPFVHRLRVRFHECDPQGVVFNAHYFAYFDVALTEMWREAFGSYGEVVDSGTDVVVAEASATFRAPARFDDELEIHVRARFGRTSMTFDFAAFKVPEETLLVTAHQTLVFIERATRRPIPIPDDYREPFGVL